MKHFDKYVTLIESGDIVVGRLVKLAVKRVERFKKQYIFKQSEVDRRIAFIENETSQTKGASGKLILSLSQKVWLEVAWGFYTNATVTKVNPETMAEYTVQEERRLIHEVPIIMARGSGITTLGSAIAMVGLLMDGEYGADVQLLAYNRDQAGYLFNASRAMTSRDDTLLKMMVDADILHSTKRGLLYETTNSLMSIKTSDYESLDGTNCHYNLFDEVHTFDDDFLKVVNDHDYNEQSYIFNDTQNFMVEHHTLPIVIGYDDWSASEIVSMFTHVDGDVCYNVTQTTKTFSQPMKVYKELLGNGKILFGINEMLTTREP